MHFADDFIAACERKKSIAVVGLDPRVDSLPAEVRRGLRPSDPASVAAAYAKFGRGVIDAVKAHCPAVKIQSAFFEQWGWQGVKAYWHLVAYARRAGLLVIGDVKRGDIGSTAEAYATGHLGRPLRADAVTVNPYLGSDSVEPFVVACRKTGGGLFILVKTSNPGSGEIQDLKTGGRKIFQKVAELVNKWGASLVGKSGYSSVGAVVGATYPVEIRQMRALMPRAILLIPGYGAQGGQAADVAGGLDSRGRGAAVAASRSVIFAHLSRPGVKWKSAVTDAVVQMNRELSAVTGR